MSTKIYVGNLDFNMSEEELSKIASEYGEVSSVAIIKDKFTNKSKGFGFIEMKEEDAANQAIAGLNGREVNGRRIKVDFAREERSDRSGGRNKFRGNRDFRDKRRPQY